MGDSGLIKIGPVGSKSGNLWDEQGRNRISQIFISHDEEINSIQFQYIENGNLMLSDRHGENDGYKFDVVKLHYVSEYITRISGWKSNNNGRLCSITFTTNHGEYGPFGRSNGHDKEFCFSVGEDKQFGGFHGNADNNGVKSIGIYLKPNTALEFAPKDAEIMKAGEKWEVVNESCED